MRILIVNDMVKLGGGEQIAWNQGEIFITHGHEIRFLCFRKGTARDDEIDYNYYSIIPIKSSVDKLVFNPSLYYKVRNFVKEYAPDIIIVHGLWSSPITIYKALKGYNIIQVVHECKFVCPSAMGIIYSGDDNYYECRGYKYHNCVALCKCNGSKLQVMLRKYIVVRTENLRKKVVREFVSPSIFIQKWMSEYGYNCIQISNPLIGIPLDIFKKKLSNENKKYIYVGNITKLKGLISFFRVFVPFCKGKKVELHIYGGIMEDEDLFNSYVNDCNAIFYHGYVDNMRVREAVRQADFLIMPSIGLENYPTAVLEAMAEGTVILGSRRGGITELLEGDCGLLYDPYNSDDLFRVLEYSYTMKNSKYQELRENAFSKIKNNNSEDVYYKQIMDVISRNIR